MRERIERAWSEACWALGVRARASTLDDLIARYDEPHRRYHDRTHLDACITTFDEHRALAERPGEALAALLFHDVIYDPAQSDNEARSAELARAALFDVQPDSLDRIARAIEATRTHVSEGSRDIALVLDIDLSILGAERDTYDAFEKAIRAEYAHVPDEAFANARRAVLESFARRDRLFVLPAFHDALDARARENLARAIASLRHW